MPQIEIRRLHADELAETVYPLRNYAFQKTPPLRTYEDLQSLQIFEQESDVYALFEDGEPVASVALMHMTQNVRDVIFPMSGYYGVVTHPKGRRKGYVRRLMRHSFEKSVGMGQVVSTLYPFRESFYERLGYVSFPQIRQAVFPTSGLAPLLRKNIEGEVTIQHFKSTESAEIYKQITEAKQKSVHGWGNLSEEFIHRRQYIFDDWLAIAKIDGQIEGVMLYQIEGFEKAFEVERFIPLTTRGKYLLLEWIARHTDQTRTVKIRLAFDEYAELWLNDLDMKWESYKRIHPMGRVLDVMGIGGISVGSGEIHLRIIDPDCEWNNGDFHFASNHGRLEVAKSEQSESNVTIQGLSALVYGTHDPEAFRYYNWGDLDSETCVKLRQLFPRRLPYLNTKF